MGPPPPILRGAVGGLGPLGGLGSGSTLDALANGAGGTMELSRTEARIIYWRNMTILLLSLVVGSKTLWAILSGWRHTYHNPVRKFANTLMAILLGLEVLNTVIWLIGVNLAGVADGSAPWKPASPARVDRWCFPISVVNYWLDPMMFFWHAIMAFFIWAWVVRDRDVGMLQRQVPLAFALASLVSAGVTVIPIRNHNLGLWPHSDCFVRKSWWGPHQPTTGVMLDRMILLPLSWLAILVFNVWSIIHLRGETGRFLTLTSIKRLQLRLVLITVTFIVIWVLMSIPLYANTRTFALELSVKWAFSIGFVDAMIYGTWSYPGTIRCLSPCMPSLRNLRLSMQRFWMPESQQQRRGHLREQELPRSGRAPSFWETILPDAGDASTASYGESGSFARAAYGHPARLPRRTSTEPGRVSRPSLLSLRTSTRGRPSPLQPYHIFATTFDQNFRCLPLQGGRRDCGEGASGTCAVPSSPASGDLDPVLQRGLEAWIPAHTSCGAQYHLYVVAVQRCRALSHLPQIIHTHLGGSGRYVLAGSAEIGDAINGRTAILLFARTVDVESGAFRLLASNQRPVVLRGGMRSGIKGVLGMAFSYYDTTMAVINAHLPATSLYTSSAPQAPLDEREKHIESMLHELRIGAGNQMWDAQLQYHHVILLGNLNYRMRLSPEEMFDRVKQASMASQVRFEEERELLRGGAGLEWCWRRGAGYNRFWTLRDLEEYLESPGSVPFLHGRHSSYAGPGSDAGGGWGIGLADISEVAEHRGRHPHDRGLESCLSPQPLEKAWAWVKEQDVLSRRMAKGVLLHGFREAGISFPPTFKWRTEASAEDYTEREVLQAAYVTGPRRANAYPQWSPSYTDRILVHSLDDIQHRCILGAYDMCDEGPLARISDHRPVSLALAVIVDTSQLPSLDNLGGRSRHQARASSDTANAMALAVTQRQEERRHKPRSLSGIEQLLTLQRHPSAGPRAFPLLVCMVFSRFRFNFRGFDVLGDQRWGSEEREEEKLKAEAAKHGGQPSEPQPALASPGVPTPTKPPSRSKSWLRLPSFRSETDAAARRREDRAATSSRQEEEELLSIIDHVLILYPLPCEDPLLPIRRAQMLGESLQANPRTELVGPSRHPSASEGERSGQRSCTQTAATAGTNPLTASRMLENLHRVDWQPGFEAPDESQPHAPPGQPPALGGRPASGLAATLNEECKQPGQVMSAQQSIVVDILTLGPPRAMQHALIKFMGKRGKELGQGVMCVGELLMGSGGDSAYSRCSSPREQIGRWGPPPSVVSSRPSSSGVVASKHTLALTVGGRFKGTVEFELAVKAKRRARREGEVLQRTMEEASGGEWEWREGR